MNYCFRYNKHSRFLNEAQEIILNIREHHEVINVINYLKEVAGEQTIILNMTELPAEKVKDFIINANLLLETHTAIKFLIRPDQKHLVPNDFPHFFLYYCNTMEKVAGCIAAGATDVYITDELGFQLNKVGEFCHKNNVKVRVFPNVCQSSSILEATNTLANFFIRPEDEAFYSPYVDIYEFYGELSTQDVLYEIYSKHEWADFLGFIITGFDEMVKSDRLLPFFGQNRVKCGKRCLDRRCDICNASSLLAKELNTKLSIEVEYPHDLKEHTLTKEDFERLKVNNIKPDEEFTITY